MQDDFQSSVDSFLVAPASPPLTTTRQEGPISGGRSVGLSKWAIDVIIWPSSEPLSADRAGDDEDDGADEDEGLWFNSHEP